MGDRGALPLGQITEGLTGLYKDLGSYSETVSCWRVLSREGNCLTSFKRIPLAPTLRIGWWRRDGSGRCRSRGNCGRLIAVAQARNS